MRQDLCLKIYTNSTVPAEAVYQVLSYICLVLYPRNVIGKEF